jgi:hypothetical protein
MTSDAVTYFKRRVAEAIAARMAAGLSYDEATREAFAYCNARWPHLLAAVLEGSVA